MPTSFNRPAVVSPNRSRSRKPARSYDLKSIESIRDSEITAPNSTDTRDIVEPPVVRIHYVSILLIKFLVHGFRPLNMVSRFAQITLGSLPHR